MLTVLLQQTWWYAYRKTISGYKEANMVLAAHNQARQCSFAHTLSTQNRRALLTSQYWPEQLVGMPMSELRSNHDPRLPAKDCSKP